jgi:hypothetical protein
VQKLARGEAADPFEGAIPVVGFAVLRVDPLRRLRPFREKPLGRYSISLSLEGMARASTAEECGAAW